MRTTSANYKQIWPLLRQSFVAWDAHEAPRLGAALAFYTLLSLAPLVILVIAVVALIFNHSTAENQLLAQVAKMIGSQGAQSVKGMIENARKPASGVFPSIIGTVTLLLGASGVFSELQSGLNMIWEVKPESRGWVWGIVKLRVLSFGMVFAAGFLLMVSLVISAGLAWLGTLVGGLLPLPDVLLRALDSIVSVAGTAALFALIFRYVPNAKVPWTCVWIGGTVTAVLFAVGKLLIGLYIGTAGVGSAYGAAGSLVVVIVWVYYSALIFLFGAEFTHVLDSGHRAQTAQAVKRHRANPP